MTWAVLDETQTELIAILDHAEDEQVTRSAQVASAPVETGADVVDHIRLDPEAGTFAGLLLNDPGEAGEARQRALSGSTLQAIREASPLDETRAINAFARLHDAMVNRQIVTIITSTEQLDNVVITRLVSSQRRPGVLQVSGAYRVLRRASTQLVALPKPAVKNQAAKRKDKGSKKAKEASEEVKQRSLLHLLVR